MKTVKANCKCKKESKENQLNTISFVYFFYKLVCLHAEIFFYVRTSTTHPVVFLGRALWADCVSPRMNTIASCNQFKAIRIGEKLVVKYNDWLCTSRSANEIAVLALVYKKNSTDTRWNTELHSWKWRIRKSCGNTLLTVRILIAFIRLLNVNSCFYSSMGTRYLFPISLM